MHKMYNLFCKCCFLGIIIQNYTIITCYNVHWNYKFTTKNIKITLCITQYKCIMQDLDLYVRRCYQEYYFHKERPSHDLVHLSVSLLIIETDVTRLVRLLCENGTVNMSMAILVIGRHNFKIRISYCILFMESIENTI